MLSSARPQALSIIAGSAAGVCGFATIEEAIEDIRTGKFVVVADDEDRENEGDLIGAGSLVTPEMVNFMAREARGMICMPITAERAKCLELQPMVAENTDPRGTAFTVTVDATGTFGVTTGISAQDRAATIKVVADPSTSAHDLRRPGHIFPLIAKSGGVLERAGHTEASVDLARLAGLAPAGVVCEILQNDGQMARLPELKAFALKHKLKLISVAQLIAYRMKSERFVFRELETHFPSRHGEFTVYGYRNRLDGVEHLAFVKGDITGAEDVMVRVHTACPIGDIFESKNCDCRRLLESALSLISKQDLGVLIYLRRHDRSILAELKTRDVENADQSAAEPAGQENLEFRDYGIGAQILSDLNPASVIIIANHPRKLVGLDGFGIVVNGSVSL